LHNSRLISKSSGVQGAEKKIGFLWDMIPCALVEVRRELRESSQYGRVRGQHDREDSHFQNNVPTNAKTKGNNQISK